MIRTAILDDEPLAVALLSDYALQTPGLDICYEGADVFHVLKLVQEKKIDLVLLDIQMPELTGIQFMKIAANACKIILTTAYPDYALDGFEHDAVDYLLKPFSKERFQKAIQKVAGQYEAGSPAESPGAIFIKSEYRLIRVSLQDILYLEALRDYIAVHTVSQGKILTLESLKNLQEKIPAKNFIRIHKSYIIAFDKISFIEKNRVIISGNYLPIGDHYQADFNRKLQGP